MKAIINNQKTINCSVAQNQSINGKVNCKSNFGANINPQKDINAEKCNNPHIELEVIGKGVIDVTTSNRVATVTSKTYLHEQGIASDTWTIQHNLNKFPSVTLVDSANVQFQGKIEYINENICIVYMNGATKGKAYLN